ncbi:MAG: tetratricopeptide repeat protein [Rhodospirillales bacterium]|jgi:tetratricopeptide (TPR) repeat protein|nr:tetratricopeptide repeat protein [Rhodospirillales bacterium]
MAKKTFGMSGPGSIKASLGNQAFLGKSLLGPAPAETRAAFAEAVRFHREGRLKDAETRARQVLAREPDHPDAAYLLGLVAMRTGHVEEAIGLIAKAIEGKRGVAEFHVNLGGALLASGRVESAIQSLRTAIDIDPETAGARLHLGAALLQRGELDEAVPLLREAARLAAGHAGARMNLGSALMELGESEAALAEFDAALAIGADGAPLHFNRARLLDRLGREREAVAAFERSIELDDSLAPAHNDLARVLNRRGRREEAEIHARKAISLAPKNPDFRLNYGDILVALGRSSEALTCFESLEQEFPELAQAYLRHAKVFQDRGDLERARGVIDTLRHIDPNMALVFHRLAADPGVNFTDDELAEIASFVENDQSDETVVAELCFDMGGVLERRGRYDDAFPYYVRANKIVNAACDYDPQSVRETTTRLISTFDADFFEARRKDGMADDRPVFIVGMPCSGTERIEEIIARHRWAGNAGETKDFAILERELPEMLGSEGLQYPACVDQLDRNKVQRLAGIYLNRMSRTFPQYRRFIDATPDNFRRLGLIAFLFPRARIIHCRRSPMEICFSIFAQGFDAGHAYAYDMDNLSHFFGEYQRLMDHWRQVCPTPVLDVAYEELVAHPEENTRQMLDFCGLDEDDDCFAFGQAETSGSAYAPSRWKPFEGQLQRLKKAL